MMDGIKGLGGGKLAIGVGNGDQVIIQDQDMGDGMQCSDHPYRNNPGGICAFCLQEKLGKLVSSSFPLPVRNSASSSSSPSFRSDITGAANAGALSVAGTSSTSLSLSVRPKPNGESLHHDEYYTRRARMSFLLARKKKKVTANGSENSHSRAADMVFKRSKSTTTPRRGSHFMDAADEFSPRKRNGFWSFLYHHHKTSKKIDNKSFRDNSKISSSSSFASSATTTTAAGRDKSLGSSSLRNKTETSVGEVEDDSSPNSQATASASSFERKVSRSRSVGCGSRSFSSDFFERISTGFGDCTLRMNAMLVYVMAAEGIFAGFFNGWYYKDPHNTLAEMVVPPPVRPPTITKFLKPYVLKMHFTNKFVTAQVIHSPTATVASSASSQEKALRESLETHRDVAAAAKIGKILGERLLLKNIPAVSVHLKREQKYHGKVKAVIDNVVEAGVKLL